MKIKCVGWTSYATGKPIKIKCGKTITNKNSMEESRMINKCYKCFNKECREAERSSN